MADEVSKTGVFIDAKTGKVVNSQPEEGYQLVPPGGVIDANAETQIEAAKTAAAGGAPAPTDQPADADTADKTITTKTTTRRP